MQHVLRNKQTINVSVNRDILAQIVKVKLITALLNLVRIMQNALRNKIIFTAFVHLDILDRLVKLLLSAPVTRATIIQHVKILKEATHVYVEMDLQDQIVSNVQAVANQTLAETNPLVLTNMEVIFVCVGKE
jgi:hypothetical protein